MALDAVPLFEVEVGRIVLFDSGRAAFADDQPDAVPNPVRDAGPEAMRDPPKGHWSAVDEASDQSFPASDPPANY